MNLSFTLIPICFIYFFDQYEIKNESVHFKNLTCLFDHFIERHTYDIK
jgi:hypothetical protein